MTTRKELKEARYKLYTTGSCRGYVSRKSSLDDLSAIEYNGKYGKDFKVLTPRFDTTQYVNVEYYLKEAKNGYFQ